MRGENVKRLAFLPVLIVALAVVGVASADSAKNDKVGPFVVTTTDNGSCSIQWATDTIARTYYVHMNNDGSYRVREEDKGTFVTTGPGSPGACETDSHHGTVLAAGHTGKLEGWLEGTVTGGTFNPTVAANCGGAPTCFRDTFIAAAFGPTAQFTCFAGYADCRFLFEYTAPDQGLAYHHWSDTGLDGVTEVFRGDIADS
jgi:hypothetical protein